MKLHLFIWFFLATSFLSHSAEAGARNVAEGSGSDDESAALVCDPPCTLNKTVCVKTDDGNTTCQLSMDGAGKQFVSTESASCENNKCMNGATCVDEDIFGIPVGYKCICASGWGGNYCDEGDACTPNPCGGDCECKASCKHELGYQCVSAEGYIGKNCDIAIPTVSCGESRIAVEVSEKFYEEFDGGIGNSVFYLSPNYDSPDKCKATVTLSGTFKMEIPLPFSDCGTFVSDVAELMEQGIPFENKLWINRETGAAYDMPVPVANFTCVYARDYAVTTALEPIIQSDPVRIGRSGKFSVEFSLCKKDSCPAQCPTYLTVKDYGMYTVGEVIHVNVKVHTGQVAVAKFVATLERMFLSCSADPFDSSSILTTMTSGGCERSTQAFKFSMRAGDTTTPESVCASFQLPMASTCSTIFIHAEVLLCLEGDLTSCASGSSNSYCASAAGRRKRSLNQENVAYAVLGPITVINGSVGRKIEQLYLDGTAEGGVTFQDDVMVAVALDPLVAAPNDPQSDEPVELDIANHSVAFLILGIVAFTASCVTMLSFVLSRIYRSLVLQPRRDKLPSIAVPMTTA